MRSVYFIDENTGWVVGQDGIILHTTNSGVSFIEEDKLNTVPTQYSLTQNFPNPFNPLTKIKYTVPTSPFNPSPYQGEGNRERLISLRVFDVLENKVATLVNEEKPAGEYEVEFNGGELTGGIYFYQLRTVDPESGSGQVFVETKKMVLLR